MAIEPRRPGQCTSVFKGETRCRLASGHRGMHTAGRGGWMDREADDRAAALDGVAADTAKAERAFAELLGEGIIKP